jgi:erythronate-4-phosphate dehydrogenase
MNILADASLPGLNEAFPAPFNLTRFHHLEEVAQLLPGQDILLCDQTLLKNHTLKYVATATSGTDHLDRDWLAAQNIQVIDAKGCNARAVADYIVSCLAYLHQQKLIHGNKAGVIGLGKAGSQVAQRLSAADFELCTYDPPKALREPCAFQSCTLEALYQSDLLCIHAELHETQPHPSMNLLDQQFLTKLKPGCVIINAARGGIVNEEALLNPQLELTYCADVYINEPDVDTRIIDKATLCTPHIAGHSLEAKYTAVAMVSERLHQMAGFSCPKFAIPQMKHHVSLEPGKSWQENVLSLYNPVDETRLLKEAVDKKGVFLKARTNHQQRHNFYLYCNSTLDEKTRLLLGDV